MNMNRDRTEELDMAERSSKRPKTTSRVEVEDAAAALPALPPDTWANVMGYLPLADVMSLSSTSKSIHDDATPLVTRLHIMKACEMNPNLARKFRDVRDIFIYSLVCWYEAPLDAEWYDDDGISMHVIDYETSVRAVPFLSNNFDKLERVFFGSTLVDEDYIDDETDDDDTVGKFISIHGQLRPFVDRRQMRRRREMRNRKSSINMSTLIDSISAAYRCGALSSNLAIRGLSCLQGLNEYDDSNGHCQCCHRAVESWPIKSVAAFECGGSSDDQIASGRSYDLDVCIKREELESILAARPGGQELLHSKFRLFNLLGKGRREIIDTDKNGLVCIAYYTKEQLREIKRAVKYANIKAFDLDPREMTQCMVKSLSSEMFFPTPSSFTFCLLSVKARDELNADLGLTFEYEDVGQSSPFLKFLVDGIDNRTFEEDIEEECLSVLLRLVSIPNPPIREIVESNAVPHMLELIEERCDESFSKLKSSQIVAKLIVEGSRNGHESDNNDVTSLCNLLFHHEREADSYELRETDLKAATLLIGSVKSVGIDCVAIMILYDVIKKFDTNTMSALVDAGLATNTIQFLNRACYGRDYGVAIDILYILAMDSKKLLWDVLDAGVMNSITSSRDENQVLRDEWEFFLDEVVRNYNDDTRLLQEIVDHVGIDCLVNTINAQPDGEAIEILCVIMAELKHDSIITAAVESGVIKAVKKTRLRESLLRVCSIIAQHSGTYQDEVLKSGVLDRISAKLSKNKPIPSRMSELFLSLLNTMSLRGQSKPLVEKVIALGLAPFLAETTAHVDRNQLSFSVEILLEVVKQDISTINGIVEAGLVFNLARFLQHEQYGAEQTITVQNASEHMPVLNALELLEHITGYSSYYRDKVLKSGIVDLFYTGVNQSCVGIRTRWLVILRALVALYTSSTKAIHQVVDSGVTEALLDSLEDEDEVIFRCLVTPILVKTRDYFVQKIEIRVDLLEDERFNLNKLQRLMKKRALLVEKNEDTNDGDGSDTYNNLNEQLGEVDRRICRIQKSISKIHATNAGTTERPWHLQLNSHLLPDLIDEVDMLLKRHENLIEKINAVKVFPGYGVCP